MKPITGKQFKNIIGYKPSFTERFCCIFAINFSTFLSTIMASK